IRPAKIDGLLNPGDNIVVAGFTEQRGLRPTPVREALILLEREGLVVAEPNRGSYVRAFTEDDVTALFSMRSTIENAAGEACIASLTEADHTYLDSLIELQKKHIAAGNPQPVRSVDMDFHRFLIEKSQNPLIERFWSELVAQIAALLYMRAEAMPDYNEYLAVSDHSSIVFAYRQRDLNELYAANRRINGRVAGECREAIRHLSG
ncbi:MAG: GntR family transcriptional regulator, partial [Chloroflexota bacterium]